jgi:hypothetical protein
MKRNQVGESGEGRREGRERGEGGKRKRGRGRDRPNHRLILVSHTILFPNIS